MAVGEVPSLGPRRFRGFVRPPGTVDVFCLEMSHKPGIPPGARRIGPGEYHNDGEMRREWRPPPVGPRLSSLALPLRIGWSGVSECPADFAIYRTRCDFFAAELVTHGEAYLVQGGKRYTARPGDVYLLHRGQAHEYGTSGGGKCIKHYVQMNGAMLDAVLYPTGLINRSLIRLACPDAFLDIQDKINRAIEERGPGASRMLSLLAYELLLELAEQADKPAYPEALAAAIDTIGRCATSALSLEDIARASSVSRSHLSHLFKKYCGTSPLKYHVQLRIEAAKGLLLQKGASVKGVAFALGYGDPLYFSTQFKGHTGLSPRQFQVQAGVEQP